MIRWDEQRVLKRALFTIPKVEPGRIFGSGSVGLTSLSDRMDFEAELAKIRRGQVSIQ